MPAVGAAPARSRLGDTHPAQQSAGEASFQRGAPGDVGILGPQMGQCPGAQPAVAERFVQDDVGDHALGALVACSIGHPSNHPADVHQQETLLPRALRRRRQQQVDTAVGQQPAMPPAPTPSGAPVPSLDRPWCVACPKPGSNRGVAHGIRLICLHSPRECPLTPDPCQPAVERHFTRTRHLERESERRPNRSLT